MRRAGSVAFNNCKHGDGIQRGSPVLAFTVTTLMDDIETSSYMIAEVNGAEMKGVGYVFQERWIAERFARGSGFSHVLVGRRGVGSGSFP